MAERRIRTVRYGNTERRSFAQVDEVIDMPNLIEVQKKSYNEFIEHGIGEVFKDFSPITDFAGRIELHFLDYHIEDRSKYTEKECKDRDATYATPLKVRVRLVYKETGQMTEQEVFMGDLPKMTPNGSFIINGAERVIVSQLVRSPGVYFSDETKDQKTGKVYYTAQSIPSRGAWLEYEMEPAGTLAVHVDRQRKVPVTTLIRALSAVTTGDFGDDASINRLFHEEPIIAMTCSWSGPLFPPGSSWLWAWIWTPTAPLPPSAPISRMPPRIRNISTSPWSISFPMPATPALPSRSASPTAARAAFPTPA